MIRIAIFASGSGSNAENIINYFKDSVDICVPILLTNNANAGVIVRAQRLNVPILIFTKKNFKECNQITEFLINQKIDWIILAGFLWLVPSPMISAFPSKIINIHPALLPKYGGKGMYGHKVHDAVLAGEDTESGITIHYVDEHYDNGDVILQVSCPVYKSDTSDTLSARIHSLEHTHFAKVVEDVVGKL